MAARQGDPDLPRAVRRVRDEATNFLDDPQRMEMCGSTVLQLLAFVVDEEVLTVREVKQVVRHDRLPRAFAALVRRHCTLARNSRCDHSLAFYRCRLRLWGARTAQPGASPRHSIEHLIRRMQS